MSEESRYITPPLRCSYPKLFEPEVNDKGTQVWGTVLLFEDTPEHHAALAKVEALAEEAGREKFGAKFDSLRKSPNFKWPVRRDVDKYADVEPKVIAFINARAYKTAPGVVSIYPGPDGKPLPITDPKLVYPGCYLRASLGAFGTPATKDQPSNSVSIALRNCQKVKDAPRIDSRVKAEDEFVADPNAAADLADL
jgi:hypothetical protein